MRKRSKRCFVLLAVLSAWCFVTSAPAAAQASIEVQASTHVAQFGEQISYHLETTSPEPIESVVLSYQTSDTQGTVVETMRFDPDTAVVIDYVHQIGKRYIRPFVEVTYWWTITDAADAQMVTEPETFAYTDDRFDWQTLEEATVHLHWYVGDIKSAQQALEVTIAGLERAQQDIHIDAAPRPIDIYLYASRDDLKLALPAGLPNGAEALTLYESGVILVSFPPEPGNIADLQRILPHEVTHALLYAATESEFDRVPMWLNEGLATSVEYTFVPDPNAQSSLEEAVREGVVSPLDTLCGAFPRDPAQARVAYVQSASLVNYVRDRYGREKLHDLVVAYGDGATCEGGVQRVLGISLGRLDTLWRESLAPRGTLVALLEDNGAWLLLLAFFALLPFLFVGASGASPGAGDQKADSRGVD